MPDVQSGAPLAGCYEALTAVGVAGAPTKPAADAPQGQGSDNAGRSWQTTIRGRRRRACTLPTLRVRARRWTSSSVAAAVQGQSLCIRPFSLSMSPRRPPTQSEMRRTAVSSPVIRRGRLRMPALSAGNGWHFRCRASPTAPRRMSSWQGSKR